MPNSLIQGKTWYWRQGLRQMPMHSHKDPESTQKTSELYLPVPDIVQAKAILTELSQNGINADSKKTHSTFDVVPAGSLIVYAAMNQEKASPSEKENIDKLKSYITSNEGKISEQRNSTNFLGFFSKLFTHGGK